MKGKYKRVKFWCPNCNKSLVAGGSKCKVCGKRTIGKKIKKFNINEVDKIMYDYYFKDYEEYKDYENYEEDDVIDELNSHYIYNK